jgi:hypothetical protein
MQAPNASGRGSAYGAPGAKWRDVSLIMFAVYIDDSGTAPRQRVAICAAVVIPALQILRLEREWETLNRKEGFESFHASACLAGNADEGFGNWDEKKKARVFRRVREISKKYGTKVFSFAVNKPDFDELVPDEYKRHIGSHYVWAVRNVLSWLSGWKAERKNCPPFEYIFDYSDPRDEARIGIETAMAQSQIVASAKEGRRADYVHYAFRRRQELAGLQCADCLSWTCYQYALFRFHKVPLRETAEECWKDFNSYQGVNEWLYAVTIERDRLVLVQPEMERGRSPLVSEYSTLRVGIFKASIRPPGYPSAWLRPRRARFRFARPDHCSSTTSIRLNFRVARDSGATADISLFVGWWGRWQRHGVVQGCQLPLSIPLEIDLGEG